MSFTPALAQRLFPSRTLLREICVQVAGVLLVGALAQVAVAVVPVPVTGQTLGVFLVGAALGFRRAALCLTLYVTAGAFGLPVFSGFSGGPAALGGPSGGYLVGFVLAAGTVGLCAEHRFLDTLPKALAVMILASLPIYVIGLAWLMHFVPPAEAFHSGFLVFLPGAAVKIALAAVIVHGPGRLWQG
jgi:biotin transport system substrate-specific component